MTETETHKLEKDHTSQQNMQKNEENPLLELIKFLIVALLIIIPIRFFIATPFIVKGTSMVPTFQDADYLIVDQVGYYFSEPKRGDVIVFRPPQDKSRFYIKRIIGLPGDQIKFDGEQIYIIDEAHPNGIRIDEPYTNGPIAHNKTHTVQPDEYFVMGDNRGASSDSRIWGTLPRNLIVGRAFLRLFPLRAIDIRPGDHRKDFKFLEAPLVTNNS